MGNRVLTGVSPLVQSTCVELLERTPAELARRDGTKANTLVQRRRRFEKRMGRLLPRLHNIGRRVRQQLAAAPCPN